MASKNKRRADALKSLEKLDEYCDEDLNSEKKADAIENNYVRKKNSEIGVVLSAKAPAAGKATITAIPFNDANKIE